MLLAHCLVRCDKWPNEGKKTCRCLLSSTNGPPDTISLLRLPFYCLFSFFIRNQKKPISRQTLFSRISDSCLESVCLCTCALIVKMFPPWFTPARQRQINELHFAPWQPWKHASPTPAAPPEPDIFESSPSPPEQPPLPPIGFRRGEHFTKEEKKKMYEHYFMLL